jgi:G3E family GTPase
MNGCAMQTRRFESPQNMAQADRNGILPVTALSGFLGAGKTTLLNHLIRNADGERIAIIVNDIGEVNIDASLINSEVKQLDGEVDQVIELSGGCICCSIQSDLVAAVSELTENLKIDRLIVESTGVAEPVSIAQTFLSDDIAGRPLEDSARLDSLVTVVDAAFFLEEWRASEQKGPSRDLLRQEDDRSIFELILEQIECADILVANKIDLLDAPERTELKAILQSLNEQAHYHEATQGQLPKRALLGLYLFDLKRTLSGANWLRHIENSHGENDQVNRFRKIEIPNSSLVQPNLGKSISSTKQLKRSINTFVYRARRPFEADKFAAVINRSIPGLLRAKGYCWIENQNEAVGFLSIAGSTTRCDFLGKWWAAALEKGKIDRSQLPAEVERKWESPHGDRRQELVFIGLNLDGEALKEQIDACLID